MQCGGSRICIARGSEACDFGNGRKHIRVLDNVAFERFSDGGRAADRWARRGIALEHVDKRTNAVSAAAQIKNMRDSHRPVRIHQRGSKDEVDPSAVMRVSSRRLLETKALEVVEV
jgi:hypothetical protein